jgi:hypothetical protein
MRETEEAKLPTNSETEWEHVRRQITVGLWEDSYNSKFPKPTNPRNSLSPLASESVPGWIKYSKVFSPVEEGQSIWYKDYILLSMYPRNQS